uniref:UPAR/Ly6 domain-containing protein n=1 Tax=Nothobranchius furzeri TaxID=105023 RepID=A0A8C6LUE9_NOTFU
MSRDQEAENPCVRRSFWAAVVKKVRPESLVCNYCPFNLFGVCVAQSKVTCTTNTSVCYSTRSSIFGGFGSYGCSNDTLGCAGNISSSLFGATYTTNTTCCSSDSCNPITVNGAPSTKMTFTAAVGAAILASTMGSFM